MNEREAIQVGRYLLHRKIARGGMATIHIARLMGDVGFSRIVAAKRMHPELAEDSEFVAMFLDEARIASKVHHRNVVPVLDVVTMGTEVMLVQEYIHGAPLSVLLHNASITNAHVPIPVACAIACNVLAGLHAAHETTDEMGSPLQIVHRDVSPQNIMVGSDGSARLLDFGVAKAAASAHVTRKGTFKGKLGYSSPEQIRGEATPQSDIYSLGVVLWESLVGKRLHAATNGEAQLIAEIMAGRCPSITDALSEERSWIGAYRWSQLEVMEPIVRKALDVNARRRWQTAADMEEAIAAAVPIASATDVAQWLKAVGKEFIEEREKMIAEEEASWRRAGSVPPIPSPTLEIPASHATEPGESPMGHLFLPRGPSLLIGVLAFLLALSVTFLFRDLRRTKPAPPPQARVENFVPHPPLPAAHIEPAPVAVKEVTVERKKPAIVDKVEKPIDKPVEKQVEKQKDDDDKPREKVASTPTRSRAVRTSSPRPSPPPRTPEKQAPPQKAAVTLDCSTPFYFEGKKKVFKPGCL
jgi:serine/threonine-protein kinase